ncbi:MAG: hypothetical protein KF861_11890 [Planctomycetaceae bacterium]|nr:hypothetical protein [Planctomycetaceae bacterium]
MADDTQIDIAFCGFLQVVVSGWSGIHHRLNAREVIMTATKPAENGTQPKQQPVKTIRNGAIAANIWKRQTPTGFEYLDFSLSRSWKLKDGEREGYSSNFFDRNDEALIDVVTRAADYIRQHSMAEPAPAQPSKQTSRAPREIAAAQ